MLFNSLEFLLFLPICFVVYWFVVNHKLSLQNFFILVASYVFYGWWDYRFLGLIAFSTLVDYGVGRALSKTSNRSRRKLFLGISLTINLGLLGVFKYYNFFLESLVSAWGRLGIELQASTLNIILPVGISFYTFQTLSYTIDIYRKQLNPEQSLINFAAYVAFFPQLVAGPIERASNLLPQFSRKRIFNYNQACSGIYLIIWGLFKKVVIADNCAYFVNQIFESHTSFAAPELAIGAVLFAFQIYGDFSGYSDIAIGTARLFGFDLRTNFKFPYFSKNIGDFWRRWHISLSSWFRDYVYIPLGGSRGSRFTHLRNVFIIFLTSGFWHGANWTFIVWGGIHALLFTPLLLINTNRKDVGRFTVSITDGLRMISTFLIITLAWIYFRADSVTQANGYIVALFNWEMPSIKLFTTSAKNLLFFTIIVFSISVLLLLEYFAYIRTHKEVKLNSWKAILVLFCIVFMGTFKNPSDFIYFQF